MRFTRVRELRLRINKDSLNNCVCEFFINSFFKLQLVWQTSVIGDLRVKIYPSKNYQIFTE